MTTARPCPYCNRDFTGPAPQKFCSRSCAARGRGPDLLARFWSRVQVAGPDDCWLWLGEVNNHGYARFLLEHRPRRIRELGHRFSYVLATGEQLDGRVLMHTCDNPPCVNPSHLRVGTQMDNIHDAMAKGRLDLSGLEIGQRMSSGTTTAERAELRRRRRRAA